jgi:signal transduction histidine kinase
MAQQRDFLADAAHELRTPLAVIQASASQALARPRERDEYVQALAEIRAAAERAGTGVAELLDLARLEGGQAVPRTAPLRLDLLAEEVAASVRVDGCAVEAVPGEPVVVDADFSLLRQAVENVVRNAAAHAAHVWVTVTTEKQAVIEIVDDGPGFPPGLAEHAFTRFQRGDTSPGTGLGLAIVRSILTAHGGHATAANRAEGGAVVRLCLPLPGAERRA